ncbi:hypothetical protein ACFLUZ_05645 [Chloroflexota bacterium]
MVFQETTLSRSDYRIKFTFRILGREYLLSLGHLHKAKHCPDYPQDENLSLSENSGYNYTPIP